MSVAYFIVPEREVEGLDPFVDGKAVAKRDDLDKLAELAGVRPLLGYFSMDPEEAASFNESMDLDPPPEGFPPVEWFDPAEGLATVRGLIARLSQLPEPEIKPTARLRPSSKYAPRPAEVIEDLEGFEEILGRLASEGVRWHLAIDL